MSRQEKLAALASTGVTKAELDKLDALDRGSLIYGNSSGATAVLGQGTADQVLTSDGTDISWATLSTNPYTALSTAATGYITLVGGLIVQWGSFTASGRTDVTTNFAITFPNACLSVAMSQTGDQDSGGTNGPYLARKTVSTTQLQVRNSAYSHTMTINYIAIGH